MVVVLECVDKEIEIIGNYEIDCFVVFYEMWCLGELCDIMFKVNGKEVCVYWVVLVVCSLYFWVMLIMVFVECDMGIILL